MAKRVLPKNRNRIFNLLKPYKPPATAWDKVYDWLVTRARVIMVFAEILVIGSFVGKVVVDIQAKSLDDQIETAQRSLAQFSTTIEPEIRRLQNKSDAYLKIWNASSDYSSVLQEIQGYVENPLSDIVVRISGDTVSVRGGSTVDDLIRIESSMRNSPTFTDVTLPTLTAESGEITAGENQYAFDARIVGEAVRESLIQQNQ